MAQLTGEITINETVLAEINGDPRLSGGLDLPVSTLAIDNINGFIYFKKTVSPTGWIDLNDYLSLSNKPGNVFGQYYFTDNTTQTTINTQNTFQKILGTTTPNSNNQSFSHTNNRLTYTGAATKLFKITTNASINPVNTTNVITLLTRIAKNNTTLPESQFKSTIYYTSDNETFHNQVLVSLSTNDYIELWVANTTNTDGITCVELNVVVEALN
jgi:hypothetical protein